MQNVSTHIPRILYKEITVQDFVRSCKPFKDQFDPKNAALVNAVRVKSLKPVIYEALSGIFGGPVTVMRKNRIMAGNHRWLAVLQLVEEKKIDTNFRFQVKVIDTDDAELATKIAWLDNHGGNKANKNTHKIEGAGSISTHVFKPIYNALTRLKCLTPSEARKNAVFIGAFLNNNHAEVERLRRGQLLTLTAFDIYDARGYDEAKDDTWFDTQAKVDLRGLEKELYELMESAADAIAFTKKSTDWTTFVAPSSNAAATYVFLAASMRGVLKEKARKNGVVTLRRMQTAATGNKVQELKRLFQDFNRQPKLCETAILDILG